MSADSDANGCGALRGEDIGYLRQAMRIALDAKAQGRHPFGAIVVDAHGSVVAEAGNDSLPPGGDPTRHAELLAAAIAARKLTPEELLRSTLYTTAEPCAMCAGAIYWCGIGRVVYAMSEHSLLELTGDHPENPTLSLPCREVFARGQRRIEVAGPVAQLQEEAAEPHKDSGTRKDDRSIAFQRLASGRRRQCARLRGHVRGAPART